MTRIHQHCYAILSVVYALVGGCDTQPSAAGTGASAIFECDLGVLPEDAQSVRASALFASGAPDSAPSAGDVFALDGDRLYALSQHGQLAVMDSADLDQLVLLGRHRLPYTPFKLFPRGDTLWVISSSARAIEPGQSNAGVSYAIALDVSEPTAIRELTSLDIPGVVDDAQLAGDVLYLVSNEHPGCSDCTVTVPPTVVTAIALDDTGAKRPRSQVRFSQPPEQWTSVNFMLLTEQRIYVAGPQGNRVRPSRSTIHVVDISAEDGALRVAGELEVAGAVQFGWQMDEREGVLRVASIDSAADSTSLVLQTFAVQASDQVEQLGRLAFPLSLRVGRFADLGGRFYGARAFLAAEGGGTLLVIDLSDPSAPEELGRVELDGTLSYLEVHDNRLFALGRQNGSSRFSVALVDVSNPAPVLRSQLGFPAASALGSAQAAQQALELSADRRLLIIPYSATEFAPRPECSGRHAGGVQLIATDDDKLSLRGVTTSAGQPRRAVLRGDHVLSIGDQQVESYTFADPDAPQLRSRLTVQQDVTFVAQLGEGVVARLTQPEDNIAPQVELVRATQAADPSQSLGGISLLDAFTTDPELRCQLQFRIQAVSARDAMLYVAFEAFLTVNSVLERRVGVLAIDASDPSTPRLAGKLDWDTSEWFELGPYIESSNLTLPTFVWSGHVLVVLEHTRAREQRLRVVDLSDPTDPRSEFVALADGRYVQLSAFGDHVFASRYQQQSGTRVRFFVDHIDISDPRAPRLLSAVNTPGALLQLDPETGRGISHCWLTRSDASCPAQGSGGQACSQLRETLQLIELEDGAAFQLNSWQPAGRYVSDSARGTGSYFLTMSSDNGKAALVALPLTARNIERERMELELPESLSGAPQVQAQDKRAFVSSGESAAWFSLGSGALELEQELRLSPAIEQVDVKERGAAVSLGAGGAQWLAAPE